MQNHTINYEQSQEDMTQHPNLTIFESSCQRPTIQQSKVECDSSSDEEEQLEPQCKEQLKNELLVSKYHPQNPTIAEDESEEVEDTSEINPLYLVSQSCAYSSYIRPFIVDEQKQKKVVSEIINMVQNHKDVYYYVIQTETSNLLYSPKVKRRYNDFKILLKELTAKYPHLIIPIIPIGMAYTKLSEKDLDERRRILQNILNILNLHDELITSTTMMNFLEQDNQNEFENQRSKDTNNSLFQSFNYTVVTTGKRSIKHITQWWQGATKQNEELSTLEADINKVMQQKTYLQDMLESFNIILKKQQQIDQLLRTQDNEQTLFQSETKLMDVVFNFSTHLNYQMATTESQLTQFYQAQIYGIQNMLDMITYLAEYYATLMDSLCEMNEKLAKVSPNQQKQITQEMTTIVEKAIQQICHPDGLYKKYMTRHYQIFAERYAENYRSILNLAIDKFN